MVKKEVKKGSSCLRKRQEFAALHEEHATAFLGARRVAVLLLHLLRGGIEFGFDALHCDARPHAPDEAEDGAVATLQHVAGEFGRDAVADRERHPEIGGEEHRRGAEEFFGADADHGGRLRIDAQGLADHVGVGRELLSPEAVADHHRGQRGGLSGFVEESSESGANTERGEVRGRHQLSPLALRQAV